MSRRNVCAALASFVLGPCLLFCAEAASAATSASRDGTAIERKASPYPARPVRFVVPFPPGAGADIVARLIAQGMSERLGQPFVIDNRAGASGTMGAHVAAKAPADGHTILLITATFSISASFHKDLPYDSVSDFAPVGRVATGPLAVVVHPAMQAQFLKELIALAKANPGKLNYASGGPGGINHLAAEMLKSATGIRIVEIPYKGGGPAITGLLAGEAQLMVATLGSSLSHIRSGKLRALALGSVRRSALLPELPTVAESGVVGYEAETWYAVLAPRGTQAGAIALLNKAMVATVQNREIQEKLAALGFEPNPSTSTEFAGYLKSEIAKWAQAIKAAGIAQN